MNGVPMTKQKEFLDSQISSIFKALNLQEIPVKEKHVRSIIIGSYMGLGPEVFWNVVMQNMPLQGNQIVCWKFCYILYKLLRDGHPNTLSISMKYKSRIKDLGKLWGHLKDGFSPLINNFCALVSDKLDFHHKNPHFPNTLNIDQKELDRHYTNDDAYFDLSTELFDYLEYILKLQGSIFLSLEQNNLNSLTLAGQCRVQPLIPCIQEAVMLYDHLVNIMLKLHINLDPSLLDGHRQRFLEIYKVLKRFFEEALRLQYLKNLVAIPQLSENAPNFCRASYRSSRSNGSNSNLKSSPVDRLNQSTSNSLYQESQKIAQNHPSILKNETDYHRLIDIGKVNSLPPSPGEAADSIDNILVTLSPITSSQNSTKQRPLNVLPQDLNFNLTLPIRETIIKEEKSTNTDVQNRSDLGIDTSDLCIYAPDPKLPAVDEENVEKLKACLDNSKVKYEALKQMYINLRATHFKMIQMSKPVKVDQGLQTCDEMTPFISKGTWDKLPLTLLRVFADEFHRSLPNNEALNHTTNPLQTNDRTKFSPNLDSSTFDEINLKFLSEDREGQTNVDGANLNMNDLTSILANIQGEFDKVMKDAQVEDELNAGTNERILSSQHVNDTVVKYEKLLFQNGLPTFVKEISEAGSTIQRYVHNSDEISGGSTEFGAYYSALYRFFNGLTLIYNCLSVLVTWLDNNQDPAIKPQIIGTSEANGINQFGDFEMVDMENHHTPLFDDKKTSTMTFLQISSIQSFLNFIKNNIQFTPNATVTSHFEEVEFVQNSHDENLGPLDARAWDSIIDQFDKLSQKFILEWNKVRVQHSLTQNYKLATTDAVEAKNRMENFEQYLEKEIFDVFEKIQSSSVKLNEKLSVFVTMKNGLPKIEDRKLFEECNDLIEAVKQLIEKAVILQKKLAIKGLQNNTDSKNFYHKGNKWSQGFISVAKLVGLGVSMFVETVTKMQQRDAKYEEIIIFAKEMTKNLAHLVWSAKIKTGHHSEQATLDTFKELFKASKKIGDHTTKILAISRSINLTYFEENFEVNLTNINMHQAKFLEIESQIKVLELESQIEKEHSKLLILRKKNYHLPDSI